MKKLTLLCIALLMTSMLVIMPSTVFAATADAIDVKPAGSTYNPISTKWELINPGHTPGVSTFVVSFEVKNVDNLQSWAMKVSWDKTVLSCSAHAKGSLLDGVGATDYDCIIDNLNGEIDDWFQVLLVAGHATGDGVLGTLTFLLVAYGETDITVTFQDLRTEDYELIDVGVVHNGYYKQEAPPPPPPTPPNAEFTPPTCTFYFVGDPVNLNAAGSTQGFDSVPPPGTWNPITEYKWEIDYNNDGSVDLTLYGVTASFDCLGAYDVAINLTVRAPDVDPSETHPDYREYNSEVHVIHQRVKPMGPNIDVYTQRGGEGPGIDSMTGEPFPPPTSWSDAFGPQENVIACAKVTYNDEPVEYKPVAFELVDPTGAARAWRTAFTNEDGIACVEFRIPWEGSGAEGMFGVWNVTATVDIAETIVMDVVNFKFGYLVYITSMSVTPSAVYKLGTVDVVVGMHNIAFTTKNVWLTLVIYDECGVPIQHACTWLAIPGEDPLSPVISMTIPKWAFVGTATVYANLFTNDPYSGGVPYCPEDSAEFTILKTL
jgi:hypothetical protein